MPRLPRRKEAPISLKDLLSRSRRPETAPRPSKEAPARATPAGSSEARASYTPPGRSVTEYHEVDTREVDAVEAHVAEFPEDLDMTQYLAFLYFSMKRYEEAAALHQGLLDRNHRRGRQFFHLGNCLFRMGDVPAAREAWNRCLACPPDARTHRKVRERLAETAGT